VGAWIPPWEGALLERGNAEECPDCESQYSQPYLQGSSSDVASGSQCCSNLLILVVSVSVTAVFILLMLILCASSKILQAKHTSFLLAVGLL